MYTRRKPFAPALSFVNETLESRTLLSGVAAAASIQHGAAVVDASTAGKANTSTLVTVKAGTLGQPITFTVSVRAAAAQGSPQGSVNLMYNGTEAATLTLSPTTSTNPRYAFSQATYTYTPQPGGVAVYFGKHKISADFIPSDSLKASSGRANFSVSQPNYTTLPDGVKIATIATGSGPQIQSGQTASVFYTGYLAKNGEIFDYSLSHGTTPLSYTLGTGQVIPGFDAGTVGMQVGETRIVEIPPGDGYGSTANGPIPANSTLVFVLTLESIS